MYQFCNAFEHRLFYYNKKIYSLTVLVLSYIKWGCFCTVHCYSVVMNNIIFGFVSIKFQKSSIHSSIFLIHCRECWPFESGIFLLRGVHWAIVCPNIMKLDDVHRFWEPTPKYLRYSGMQIWFRSLLYCKSIYTRAHVTRNTVMQIFQEVLFYPAES